MPILVDTDVHPAGAAAAAAAGDGDDTRGPFDRAVEQGHRRDEAQGRRGWEGLSAQTSDEEGLVALNYTSGTTARPKGVELTHRGAYLAALANVVEAGLNMSPGPARYLWTLPMFHVRGYQISLNRSVMHRHPADAYNEI